MNNKLENAKSLYLKGIRDGKLEAADLYTGNSYTQHSTGVKDGVEGFKEFFKDFLSRTETRDIRIRRSLQDGDYVFLHVYQNIDNKKAEWITTDMFLTDDNDKLIEHWDVISKYINTDKTKSGYDPIFGDFIISDIDKTEENKSIIKSFLIEIHQNKKFEELEKYISIDSYIEHSVSIKNGFENFRAFLLNNDVTYDNIFHIMGEGNYVVSYSKVKINNSSLAVFDIYRLENGKIVEHWDNMEEIPSIEEQANSGKF
ncbi:polyketide cyclase [Marinilabiliaceae bacterium JC040]|nr:polyketide cyclase [Marinilabiliaceae bacterium JC040]